MESMLESRLHEAAATALESGLSPLAVLRVVRSEINKRADYHVTFSTWTSGDIRAIFDATDEEAASFMRRMEPRFQEAMVNKGWDAWESLGKEAGLSLVED